MKRLYHIALALFLAVGISACTNEEEDLRLSQRDKLANFMTSKLGLKTEEQANEESNSGENINFYTVHGEWAYRWIRNYYDYGRHNQPLVRVGDCVNLTISVYSFEDAKINDSKLPLFTNDEQKRNLLEQAGLNLEYWTFEPYYVTVGAGETIKGLDAALAGCREGDVVELYMTFSMAYGRDYLSTVAPDSPIAVFFTINSIE